jgi:hypothetical protein
MDSLIKKIRNGKQSLSIILRKKKPTKSLHINKELNELCEQCNDHLKFKKCKVKHFQRNFKNWTSGNDNIDKFIQNNQLSAHAFYEVKNALEWIPYDRFNNITYIAKGGFGKVYQANWIDGNIVVWDDKNHNWKRYGNKVVALKSLNNSKNISLEFMNEVSYNLFIIFKIIRIIFSLTYFS